MHRHVHLKRWGWCSCVGLPPSITVMVLVMALLLGSASAIAFEYHTSVDSDLSTGNVTGPGGAASSVDEKLGYRADIRMTGYQDDDDESEVVLLGLSLGSDLGVGSRMATLTNLKWEKTTTDYRLKLGDVMESFSQYALSSSFKGLSYTHKLPKARDLELTIAGGYAYPRWENLYAGKEVTATQREVKGIRVASGTTSPSGITNGVSIVSSTDKSGIKPGDELYDNLVLSCDTEFTPIPNLTIRAVAALSDTTEKTNTTQAGGTAIKIEASSAAKQGRATFEYERATPGFMTAMGSAVADRQKVKLRISSNHTKSLTSTVGYLYTNDNLENQKTRTTVSNRPEIGISMRRPFNRRYASLGAALKYDFRRIAADTIDRRTVSVDYKDRFGPIDTSFSVSKDSGGPVASASEEMTYLVELSTQAELGAATLRPTLNSRLVTDRNKSTAGSNQTTDTAVGLRVDLPASNMNSNIKVGQQSSTGSSPGPKKSYADLSVYYRPSFWASLRDGRIYLRATHASYSYTDSDKDRAETSVRMGVSLSW